METTVFNAAQQNILRMLSFVNDEETVSDVEAVLTRYFASKVDEGLDALIDSGRITPGTIEQWENEHMRTPYQSTRCKGIHRDNRRIF